MSGKGITVNFVAALAFAGTFVAATTATPVSAAESQMKIANVVPAGLSQDTLGVLGSTPKIIPQYITRQATATSALPIERWYHARATTNPK